VWLCLWGSETGTGVVGRDITCLIMRNEREPTNRSGRAWAREAQERARCSQELRPSPVLLGDRGRCRESTLARTKKPRVLSARGEKRRNANEQTSSEKRCYQLPHSLRRARARWRCAAHSISGSALATYLWRYVIMPADATFWTRECATRWPCTAPRDCGSKMARLRKATSSSVRAGIARPCAAASPAARGSAAGHRARSDAGRARPRRRAARTSRAR